MRRYPAERLVGTGDGAFTLYVESVLCFCYGSESPPDGVSEVLAFADLAAFAAFVVTKGLHTEDEELDARVRAASAMGHES